MREECTIRIQGHSSEECLPHENHPVEKQVLKFRNLSTGYGHRVVSSGLTAGLQTGKVTCLLGANGSGKSTLLRTLASYQKPLAGELDQVNPNALGVVLTEHIDAMGLKVQEVVAMGRHPYTGFFGRLTPDDQYIVRSAMEQTNTMEFADRLFSSLSDGERQKVMIAKALAQQTPIILMDEPSAYLDFPSKVELMLMLRHLARHQGKAILLSTHDVGIALKTADILWLMHDGGMTIGSPSDLEGSGAIDQFLGKSRAYL